MKFRRLISSALVASLMAASLAGCGGTTDEQKPAEGADAPAAEAAGTVKMLVNVTGGKDDAELKLFEQALSEATGLTVSMEKPPSDFGNVMMQKLQGGEKYDLIYLDVNSMTNLADQGVLMDITDRVHGSEILTNNVEQSEWDDITIDGKIYAGFNKKEVHRVVQLNKNHLEAAGIDYKSIEPTLDGYYEVFKALKASNTTPDYYPYNCVLSEIWDLQPWFASIGLHSGVCVDEADGKTYLPYATDEAAPVWEWFKKLYDEKLLDPASFVDTTKDLRAKMGAGSQLTSVDCDWAMWVGLHNANASAEGIADADYEIVSLPGVKTPAGSDRDYMLSKGSASLFGIPANSENPDGAMKVLEYFATQEGGELLSIGIEGNDYTKEGDKYVQTEIGAQHANDHGAPVPIYKDFVAPLGYNRGVDEALSYGEYAEIDIPNVDDGDMRKCAGKWAVEIVRGNVSVEEGLKNMRNDLVAQGYTEK